MNIVIRADASIHIGSGHVMHCLALADGLKSRGHSVQFVMRTQQGDMFDFVERRGFTALALPQESAVEPKNSADYPAWLQVPISKDLADFYTLVKRADVVVVDHYGITIEWERAVAERYGCKLVIIDDLVRSHEADLIIDQTLARDAAEYSQSHVSTVLSGTKYALLNERFSEVRARYGDPLNKIDSIIEKNYKVLLTMGGIDKPNATLKTLEALKGNLPEDVSVTVLLSPKAINYDQVRAYCAEEIDWVTHIDFVDDMATVMKEHAVAIGAPGSTSWERACLGLPSIVVPLADNQKEICESLVKHELSLSLALDEIDEKLMPTFQTLIENYAHMNGRNLSACDGAGIKRVVSHIEQLIGQTL